ncbi:MAG: hypothetical protein IT182_12450 [Acidobacteria bacterium]|nr:hypothetical protein [Acidobacteriota bacterium]
MAITERVGRSALIETLRSCREPFDVLAAGDGEVLRLRRGARVLGLFTAGSEENLLWTHPALGNVDSAGALLANAASWNVGGDRTWIAPEVDVFFPAFPDTSICECPAALDPGAYQVTDSGLVNRFELRLSRTEATVSLELAKTWDAATAPPSGVESLPADVSHVGYVQTTTLTALACDRDVAIGMWGLLQVPSGAECLVSTRAAADVVSYVGGVTPGELHSSTRLLRYRPSTPGIHKIGVHAPVLTGRIGCLHREGDTAMLVVRTFDVDSSGTYIDTAWRTPDDLASPGCAAQLCAVDTPALGRFIELEHHTPALRIPPTSSSASSTRLADASHVWACRGPGQQIRTIAERLFGE